MSTMNNSTISEISNLASNDRTTSVVKTTTSLLKPFSSWKERIDELMESASLASDDIKHIPKINSKRFFNPTLDGKRTISYVDTYSTILDDEFSWSNRDPDLTIAYSYPHNDCSAYITSANIKVFKEVTPSYSRAVVKIKLNIITSQRNVHMFRTPKFLNSMIEYLKALSEVSPQGIFDIGNTIDSADEFFSDASEFLPTLANTCEGVDDLVSSFRNMVGNNKSLSGVIADSIKKIVLDSGQVVTESMLPILSIVASITSLKYLVTSDDPNRYGYAVISFLLASYFSSDIIGFAFDNLKKFFFNTIGTVAQSGLETLTSGACLVLLTLFGNCTTLPKHWIPLISNFDRLKSSLTSIFSFFVDILNDMINGLGLGHLVPNDFKYLFLNNDEVLAYAKQLDLIQEKLRTKNFPMTHTNYQLLRNLIDEGNNIIMRLPTQSKSGGAYLVLSNSIRTLVLIKEKFAEANFEFDGRRIVPVSIMLQGPPGNGKTEVTDHIAAALIKACLPYEEVIGYQKCQKNYIYTVAPENDFWDAYKNHFICLFNDFMQTVDNGNGGGEATKFIHAKDSVPYILNAAHLHDKGNMLFSSPVIILTTNQSTFNHVPSISSIDALFRRVDFNYIAVVKKEFSKPCHALWDRTIDYSKLPIGLNGVTSINPNIMEFYPTNLKTQLSEAPISFKEVIHRLVEQKSLNEKYFDQKTEELLQTMDSIPGLVNVPSDDLEEDILMFDIGINSPQFDFSEFSDLKKSVSRVYKYFKVKSIYTKIILNFSNYIRSSPNDPLVKGFYDFCSSYRRFRDLHDEYNENYIFIDKITIIISLLDFGGTDALKQACLGNLNPRILAEATPINSVTPFIGGPSIEHITPESLKIWKYILSKKEYILYSSCVDFLICAAGLLALIPIYNLSMTCFNKLTQPSIVASPQIYKMKQKSKFINTYSDNNSPQMGAGYDPNGHTLVESVLIRNYYDIYFQKLDTDDMSKMGGMLAVVANVVVMPLHFINFFKGAVNEPTDSMSRFSRITLFKYDGKSFIPKVHLQVLDFIDNAHITQPMGQSDCVLVHLKNPKFTIHRNIMEYIPYKKDVSKLPNKIPFSLCLTTSGLFARHTGVAVLHGNIPIVSESFEDYILSRCFTYSCSSISGDCGAVFVVQNPSSKAKIFGMHVAGKLLTSQGFSTVFFREEFEDVLVNIPYINDTIPQLNGTILYEIPSSMEYRGNVTKGIFNNNKTNIIKSVLHEHIECDEYAPGILSREAFDKALFKYNSFPIDVPFSTIQIIMRSVFDNLVHSSSEYEDKRVITFEESVFGILGTNIGPISRITSPGYPFILETRGHVTAKSKWFGVGDNFIITPSGYELKKELEQTLAFLSQRIRCEFIYNDNLKDETRPIEKVQSIKTRMFSGVSLILFILVRMYFGSFVDWLICNKIKNSIAVGINPYSTDWHYITQLFSDKCDLTNSSFTAGDFSGFDTDGKREIYYAMLECINDWYSDSEINNTIREMIFLELMQSIHIRGNSKYEWFNSLPSGHPLTVYVNSLYNLFALRYCWFRSNNNSYASLMDFSLFIYPITYGDDNICAISSDAKESYDEFIIQGFMKELGLTYTSDTKASFNSGFRNLSDISFLKRRFLFDSLHMIYVAPLSLVSILNMLKWTKKGINSIEITTTNVDGALRELSLHEKHVFEEHAQNICMLSLRYLDYAPVSTTYVILKEHALSSQFFM